MGFNEFLSSIFGNKATRDMKEIKPWVDKVKAAYPEVAALENSQALLRKRRNRSNRYGIRPPSGRYQRFCTHRRR